MAEEQSAGGADQVQTSGQEQTNTQQQDKVAYESHQKLLGEKKRIQAKADELAKKVKEYEDEKLQVQGKSQELIDSLRNQVKEKDAKLENVVGTFGYRAVENSIKAEAAKYGCLDTDLLLKAGREHFGEIEVDVENGFSVNNDDLKRFFETTVKKHPMLFKQQGPKIHDQQPNNQSISQTPKRKMSIDEMALEFAKLNNTKP